MPETHDLKPTEGTRMSDADRLMDSLASARERALLYAHGALECTNNGVREFFLAMHGEETHNQEILFSFLHTRGFYPVEMADERRIHDMRDRYRDLHQRLGLKEPPQGRRYATADPKMPPAHLEHPQHFEPH